MAVELPFQFLTTVAGTTFADKLGRIAHPEIPPTGFM
jgi:hypothetical protein